MKTSPVIWLINLCELDPLRNGGILRFAEHACTELRKIEQEGGVRLIWAAGYYGLEQAGKWAGPDGLVWPTHPESDVKPVLELFRPDAIFSPLMGQWPFQDCGDIPHIVMMPDALAMDHPEYFPEPERSRRGELFAMLSKATTILTLSEFSRRRLAQTCKLDDSKIRICPLASGISGVKAEPPPESFPNYPYVLYPANSWPHKRHDLLLKTWKLIVAERPDLFLVLTGWQDADAIMRLAESVGCPMANIRHFGMVTDSQLKSIYQGSESLIFTSCYEGFGMPVLEAMECGCPVIASRHASVPEIGGDAVLYAESDDPRVWAQAFLKILPQRRDELIAKGYSRAAEYSWDAFAKLWRGYLQGLGVPGVRIADEPPTSVSVELASQLLSQWSQQYLALANESHRRAKLVNDMARQLEMTFFSRCVDGLRRLMAKARR